MSSGLTIWGGRIFRSGRVLWAAEELGLSYTHHDISSRDGSTQTPEYLALNAAGKIPVLQHGDFVLNESAAIATYLFEQFGHMRDADVQTRARSSALCHFVMSELDAQSLYIHRKHVGVAETYGKAPTAVAAAEVYFRKNVKVVSQLLDEGKGGGPFLMGAKLSASDCILGHCLFWAAMIQWLDWDDTALVAYMHRLSVRPAWRKTFMELPPIQMVVSKLEEEVHDAGGSSSSGIRRGKL